MTYVVCDSTYLKLTIDFDITIKITLQIGNQSSPEMTTDFSQIVTKI